MARSLPAKRAPGRLSAYLAYRMSESLRGAWAEIVGGQQPRARRFSSGILRPPLSWRWGSLRPRGASRGAISGTCAIADQTGRETAQLLSERSSMTCLINAVIRRNGPSDEITCGGVARAAGDDLACSHGPRAGASIFLYLLCSRFR